MVGSLLPWSSWELPDLASLLMLIDQAGAQGSFISELRVLSQDSMPNLASQALSKCKLITNKLYVKTFNLFKIFTGMAYMRPVLWVSGFWS